MMRSEAELRLQPRVWLELLDTWGFLPSEVVRADGRTSLTFEAMRFDFFPLPPGRLVMAVELVVLPEVPAERQALVAQALRVSTAQLPDQHDSMFIPSHRAVLCLQRETDAAMNRFELEAVVEDFVSAAKLWRSRLGQESGAPSVRYPL